MHEIPFLSSEFRLLSSAPVRRIGFSEDGRPREGGPVRRRPRKGGFRLHPFSHDGLNFKKSKPSGDITYNNPNRIVTKSRKIQGKRGFQPENFQIFIIGPWRPGVTGVISRSFEITSPPPGALIS